MNTTIQSGGESVEEQQKIENFENAYEKEQNNSTQGSQQTTAILKRGLHIYASEFQQPIEEVVEVELPPYIERTARDSKKLDFAAYFD